jgi:hypothetical protein
VPAHEYLEQRTLAGDNAADDFCIWQCRDTWRDHGDIWLRPSHAH